MRILWCCLIIGILVNEVVFAQRASSPSHRPIPRKQGEAAPTFNDFKSEELRELLEEYSRARREQINRRRDPKGTPAATPSQTQSSELQQLPLEPQVREFVERLEQKSKNSAAQDTSEEITKVNDEMARRLGGPLSDTLKSDSIPLENSRNIIKDFGALIRQQQKEARKQYQQAVKAYKRIWPADGIPPDEWLKKVQPYINPELVRQLREFRDTQQPDETTSDPNSSIRLQDALESLPSSLASAPQKKQSKGMFDSLISAMDKKGTEWLKSPKHDNARKDAKNSWWTGLKSKTKARMSTINRRLTQHSRKVNQKKAATAAPPRAAATSASNNAGKMVLSIVSLATVLGLGYYLFRNYSAEAASSDSSISQVSADSIRDRESLLRACNVLAWRRFGWPSRFWNHRTIFSKLSELAEEEAVAMQLSGLYEYARYAPNGDLSSKDVELAQRLFKQLRGQSLVTR